jgi:hypothetical protein
MHTSLAAQEERKEGKKINEITDQGSLSTGGL